MEIFLNWLFGWEARLRTLLEDIFDAVYEWGHWYAARGIYILLEWYGQYVAIISYWYERIKNIVYDYWNTTFAILVTLVGNVLNLVDAWFIRIAYVVNDVWVGFQKVFGDWWSKLYDLFNNWWARATDVIYNWYDRIRTLAFDWYDRLSDLAFSLYTRIYDLAISWYDRIREIAFDWYEDVLYYIQSLPNARQLLTDWFPFLAWLLSTDPRELLFHFLQQPGEIIWLYITELVEEKLSELLETYW